MLPQEKNPLLDFSGLPRFADIKPEHVSPAVDQLLADGRATIEAVIRAKPTWDEFVAPLEDANERIGRAWGQVAHLHAVMDNPELRQVYNANLPKVSQYWTELGQNLRRVDASGPRERHEDLPVGQRFDLEHNYDMYLVCLAFLGLSMAASKASLLAFVSPGVPSPCISLKTSSGNIQSCRCSPPTPSGSSRLRTAETPHALRSNNASDGNGSASTSSITRR